VSPRALRRPLVSIALVVVALAGCAHEPYPPVTVPAPAAASTEELRWAIEGALAARNWQVVQRTPGAIDAYVHSQGSGDNALIQVTYRTGVIDIQCVKQNVSSHRYDRWMQLLSSEIQKNVAQLGMRRPPAPSPPPTP
jgi:hypothetical protein